MVFRPHGAWGDYYSVRFHGLYFAKRYACIPLHHRIDANTLKHLDDVVGERIIIIKEENFHLKNMVPRPRIELGTPGFSVLRSTY